MWRLWNIASRSRELERLRGLSVSSDVQLYVPGRRWSVHEEKEMEDRGRKVREVREGFQSDEAIFQQGIHRLL